MTRLLYMDSVEGNYLKEFDAVVTKRKKDYVCLDQSAFYPLGGGQPSDVGTLAWGTTESPITEVIKRGDTVKHVLSGELPPVGTMIHGMINWDRRYNHMKMHTAQHIISGVVYDLFGARTVGNQIHADSSRVDFHPIHLSENDMVTIEKKCSEIVHSNADVHIYTKNRDILEQQVNSQRCNLDLLPKFITSLRIVEIEGFDVCPCAGTHVRNTKELSDITIIKKESKGQDCERLSYRFV